MGKTIITYSDVIDLNHRLEEKKLNCKVHLHDACGGQSCTIEATDNSMGDAEYEKAREEIIGYFEAKRINLRFADHEKQFVIL